MYQMDIQKSGIIHLKWEIMPHYQNIVPIEWSSCLNFSHSLFSYGTETYVGPNWLSDNAWIGGMCTGPDV